jgi:predicted transcriptional regulator
MARTTSQPKEENFNFRVPADLKAAFKTAAELADRSAAQVLRDFMRAYVERELKPEPGHDEWVRGRIQAALDDRRPAVPHDAVMNRTRAIIDRMASEKRSEPYEA